MIKVLQVLPVVLLFFKLPAAMQNSRLLTYLFILIITCSIFSEIKAQATEKIHKVEYFYDTDPGIGSGYQVNVNPSNTQLNAFNFDAPINFLSNGLHQLYVRCLDSSYSWSTTTSKLFYKEAVVTSPTPNIVAAEYFYNTDPGFGNAIPTVVPNSQVVLFGIYSNIGGLPKGLHTVYVRTKDANGSWSLTRSGFFYREPVVNNPIPDITRAEYFFDTDPGFGNATPATVTPGQDINFALSESMAALNKGLHTFYVRVKDADNKWSLTHTQLFYKEPAISNPIPNVTQAEYFFDTDPGFGNGTAATVTAGQDINFSITGNMSSLSKGLHTLFVRVKDANNKWSLTNTQLFYSEPVISNPVPNITQAEYYFDTDPGFGNATAFTISPQAQNITQAISLPTAGLSKGFHRLFIRVKDANNKWSLTNTPLFYYESIVTTPALTDLISFEWFWNTDPGFGNANKITIPAGNNGQLTDFVFEARTPFAYSNTLQNFYVRTIDANWSLTTVKLVDFTNVTLPVTLLEFTARADNKNVVTSWHTAQEINLKHYVVEHSIDGVHFVTVGNVIAKANNSSTNDYEFTHINPAAGANYYRLKQVDNDDKFTYSPIVKINFTAGNRQPIAYPNPVKNNLTLAVPNELFTNENYQVVLLDAKKSLIIKQTLTQATMQIEMSHLAAGTYWLVLIDQNGKSIYTKTIIKE